MSAMTREQIIYAAACAMHAAMEGVYIEDMTYTALAEAAHPVFETAQKARIQELETALGDRNHTIRELNFANSLLRAEAREYYGHDKRKRMRDLRAKLVAMGERGLAEIDRAPFPIPTESVRDSLAAIIDRVDKEDWGNIFPDERDQIVEAIVTSDVWGLRTCWVDENSNTEACFYDEDSTYGAAFCHAHGTEHDDRPEPCVITHTLQDEIDALRARAVRAEMQLEHLRAESEGE